MKTAWRTTQHHGSFFLIFFSLIYLVLNIFASESISSLYPKLVNEEKVSAIEYLRKISPLPIYKNELTRYKSVFGTSLENEVLQEKRSKDQLIQKLEQLLTLSPKSRDVLYSLFLIYNERGDKTKAQNYFNQAKEIDPTIK